jgi:site-specific DNA-methyltransferase (cytosine-N4-specific)
MIIAGDCRQILPTLATASAHTCVTSPPYLQQRQYGSDDTHEIGRESSLAAYCTAIGDVFDEVRRILIPGGMVWLNIGDKANTSGGAGGDWSKAGTKALREGGGPGKFHDDAFAESTYLDVPGAVVAELLRRGWRLRMPIVWNKLRQAPESLQHVKRPRFQHEMIYLLTPTARKRSTRDPAPRFYPSQLVETGSIWSFAPGGDGDAHLAPFPDELARRCILPSTLPGDVVLDPFAGSGTVPRVAQLLGRRAVGIELYAGERAHLINGVEHARSSRRLDERPSKARA